MQNATPFWSSPLGSALNVLAVPVASLITFLLTRVFTRRQQSAETHKTDAEGRLADAQADKTEAEAKVITSTIINNAYRRQGELEQIARDAGLENTELKQRILTLEFDGRSKDRKIAAQAKDIEILDLQVQRARAAGFLSEDRGQANPAAKPE